MIRPVPNHRPPPTPTPSRPSTSSARPETPRPTPGVSGPPRKDTTWKPNQKLSEARNEHRTNTRQEFEKGLRSDNNWFEGDVRVTSKGQVMQHDRPDKPEPGDHLSLREWLSKGKASGRGLKLDFKEIKDKDMPGLLKTIKEAKIPDHRLMFNLGRGAAEKWGPEIRKQSPNAIIAINPPKPPDGKPVGAAEARKMVETAKKVGGPVTFVVDNTKGKTDFGKVIPEFKKLPGSTISVWGESANVEGRTQELRKRGVNGLIDLEQKGAWERIKDTFE